MLKHVLHTGMSVADLGAAVSLYKSLGFEIANQFEKPEPKAHVATVKNGNTAFELWQFEDTAQPLVEFIRSHIAIYSDNLDKDIEQLISNGYRLVIPTTDGVVLRYAFVQDSSGTCYEIATDRTRKVHRHI